LRATGKDMHYVKKLSTRFDSSYRIDDARVAEDALSNSIFPLVALKSVGTASVPFRGTSGKLRDGTKAVPELQCFGRPNKLRSV